MNSKREKLSVPLLSTVNCVIKLNPEADPSPPLKLADHTPPVTLCAVGLLLPQPFSMIATSNRIATSFMNVPSDWDRINFKRQTPIEIIDADYRFRLGPRV